MKIIFFRALALRYKNKFDSLPQIGQSFNIKKFNIKGVIIYVKNQRIRKICKRRPYF